MDLSWDYSPGPRRGLCCCARVTPCECHQPDGFLQLPLLTTLQALSISHQRIDCYDDTMVYTLYSDLIVLEYRTAPCTLSLPWYSCCQHSRCWFHFAEKKWGSAGETWVLVLPSSYLVTGSTRKKLRHRAWHPKTSFIWVFLGLGEGLQPGCENQGEGGGHRSVQRWSGGVMGSAWHFPLPLLTRSVTHV